MSGQVSIRKWGNTQGICIPKEIMKIFNWNISDTLLLKINGDELVIKKAFIHKSYEERLRENGGITNTVSDFDWGDPVGKEIIE